ncbi:MAG: hypothetical protein AMS21_09750 [Gemmatimonas sp. SG8_38_2]|nr:MAG: hypothetical protein AMS21_09750 [Gemmatimonas sp. SG8_38_2]
MTALLLVAALAAQAPDLDEGYLYRTLTVRAAPGDLLELIDLYVARMPAYEAAGDEPPFIMRHSQGDHWDLLLLFPMGSEEEYFSPERIARRESAALQSGLSERIAWREDLYVLGPALEVVREAFENNAYYHVEMFIALPRKRAELLEEREMENAYLEGIDRPQNLIFTRASGAAWDSYTIGFYKDLKHYAASADIPDAEKEASAKAAGFEGADRIGTYLRTLIQRHQDTLATAVR